jgi:hypothetical protein
MPKGLWLSLCLQPSQTGALQLHHQNIPDPVVLVAEAVVAENPNFGC